MAQQLSFQKVTIFKNKENTLGIGSYGAVYRAKCDELPCAAKCLHPVFFQFNNPGVLSVTRKFERECHLLSAIKHPHIVQCLGTVRDPHSGQPVLLMELMDESLTTFLERQNGPLPYHVQVNLAHDITLALAYLHSNGIIHQDLSSNNILLIAGSRAKVTDFGLSRLIDANPNMTPLTQCPGTLPYMPPEALLSKPLCTKKLDIFSDGVLMIQLMTRKFPKPGSSTSTVKDSRSPTGVIQIPVSETERRKSDINLIDPTHPLLPIALDCLKDMESKRPSAKELCHHIAAIKEAPRYAESAKQANTLKQIPAVENPLQAHILELQQQMQLQGQQKDAVIAAKEEEIQHLRQRLQQENQQEKDWVGEKQPRELIQQLLANSDHIDAEFEENVLQKKGMVTQQESGIRKPDRQRSSSSGTSRESIQLSWSECEKIPCTMAEGTAAVGGTMAYFSRFGSKGVYGYNSEKGEWSQLPDCPNEDFSLAVVWGLLTAVGGRVSANRATDTLLSLTEKDEERRWSQTFPHMPSKRCKTAVACDRDRKFLLVAGGIDGSSKILNTVEVMNVVNLQWYSARSLPHPMFLASATICGNNAYLLGGVDHNYRQVKSVLTCSLTTILQSCQRTSRQIWHKKADIPVCSSTCTTLRGELVAVGGYESECRKETTAVYQYNPSADSWEVISHMNTARSCCFVVVVQDSKLLVVGGSMGGGDTDIAEMAVFL